MSPIKKSLPWIAAIAAAVVAGILLAHPAPPLARALIRIEGLGSAFCIVAGLACAVTAGWVISARNMKRAAATESRKFATLLDAAPEVIIGVGDDGLIRFANTRVQELFGYAHAELIGAPVELLIPERFHRGHVASRAHFVAHPQRRPMGNGMSLVARRRNGSEVQVEISLSRIDTREGHIALCIIRDVTEQAGTRQALVDANNKLKASLAEAGRRARELRLLRQMGELLQCCVSEREAHQVLAKALTQLLPNTAGALYLINSSRNLVELATTWNRDPDQLTLTFQPQDCWALRRGRVHSSRGANASARCNHPHVDGKGDSLCLPVAAHGETMGVLCACASHTDRDERRTNRQLLQAVAEQGAIAIASLRLRDALRAQSTRDPLTGLYNRRFLDECLDREVSGSLRTGSALSVMMLDLDHFKRFNDTFGHQSGDQALREVASMLSRTARRSDIVCRFGGEELVMLLPETTAEQALQVAENVRNRVQQLLIRHKDQVLGGLTVSIGIASCPDHALAPAELLRAADMALYSSKRSGRNRVLLAVKTDGGDVAEAS